MGYSEQPQLVPFPVVLLFPQVSLLGLVVLLAGMCVVDETQCCKLLALSEPFY